MNQRARSKPLWSLHQNIPDVLLVVLLATGIGYASYQGGRLIDPVIFETKARDVWFDGDISRVTKDMNSRQSNQYRTSAHPLFPLMTFPLVASLKHLGVERRAATELVIATAAALWVSILFLLLRLVGCQRLDATLFTLLGGTTAAAMFWFVVPETHIFGSLSILVALCVVALAQHLKLPSLWFVIASALTLSFTITNWMVGIFAAVVKYPLKKSLNITAQALVLVVVLWGVQKLIFPTARFFFNHRQEVGFMFRSKSGGPLKVLNAFLFHSFVMPDIQCITITGRHDAIRMSVQQSFPGSGGPWGTAAVLLWCAVLGLGLWGLMAVKRHRQLCVVLALTLFGQFVLHAIYGEETFMFSLNWVPLLVIVAAFGTFTRARRLGLLLAALLILCLAVNNTAQFAEAAKTVTTLFPFP